MTSASPRGRIITFYSYKGGTGRSMAVANIAWILASNQRRVLVIDWDLEAPGMHRYFRPFIEDKELQSSPGIIDYFVDFVAAAREEAPPRQEGDEGRRWFEPFTDLVGYSRSLDWDFGSGYLDFVPAGRQGPEYPVRVGGFNWQEFYTTLGGGLLLEALKTRLRKEYDYVLIDSRTGISDTSGICTVQMPDDVVVCFTLNRQSTLGTAAVARSILEQRRKPTGEPAVRIWPVPMRVDSFEQERLERARDLARRQFAPFMVHLARTDRAHYWSEIGVPYKAYFSYEEVLATFAERRRDPTSVLAAMERIARRISDVTELGEMSEQDRLRGLALFDVRSEPTAPAAARLPRVFVSYLRSEQKYAEALYGSLYKTMKSSVFIDTQSVKLGEDWDSVLSGALADSHVVLSVIGPSYRKYGPYDIKELVAARTLGKLVVPVLVGGTEMPRPSDLPPELSWLARLRGTSLSDDSWDRDAETLVEGLLRAAPTPAAIDPEDPQKGQWGGSPTSPTRMATARVGSISDRWFAIDLEVRATGPEPISGPVAVHLPPTFVEPSRVIQSRDGVARLQLQAHGAFTVGIEADDGSHLELDLSTVPGAPAWFVEH